jgi:hypothetical protein
MVLSPVRQTIRVAMRDQMLWRVLRVSGGVVCVTIALQSLEELAFVPSLAFFLTGFSPYDYSPIILEYVFRCGQELCPVSSPMVIHSLIGVQTKFPFAASRNGCDVCTERKISVPHGPTDQGLASGRWQSEKALEAKGITCCCD